MKIKYEFADGTVSEVEVEESIGAVIIDSRRKEDNLSRKERYHCYSLDAMPYGDKDKFMPYSEEFFSLPMVSSFHTLWYIWSYVRTRPLFTTSR